MIDKDIIAIEEWVHEALMMPGDEDITINQKEKYVKLGNKMITWIEPDKG